MQARKFGRSQEVMVTADYAALSKVVADIIIDQLITKPASSLALPIGKSLFGCYEILADQSRKALIDWSAVKCFALDDYLDIDEVYSFQRILQARLYEFANIQAEACFNPRFQDNYDQVIADCGGLDCCILGLGTNGHIAFNEPGTPANSWTHCLWLSESTREANKDYFAGASKIATKAISMGISTILASKKIILVATGNGKKEVLQKALSGPVTEWLPASLLSLHPNVITVTDFHY
jgi:glucosamine-6-phosphate deaminase